MARLSRPGPPARPCARLGSSHGAGFQAGVKTAQRWHPLQPWNGWSPGWRSRSYSEECCGNSEACPQAWAHQKTAGSKLHQRARLAGIATKKKKNNVNPDPLVKDVSLPLRSTERKDIKPRRPADRHLPLWALFWRISLCPALDS